MPERPLTGDPQRWPHLEAFYDLALRAATGFVPPPHVEGAFTAARWGLHMGLTLARLDPDLADAVNQEMEWYDRARDGDEAATYARFLMARDVAAVRALARTLLQQEES